MTVAALQFDRRVVGMLLQTTLIGDRGPTGLPSDPGDIRRRSGASQQGPLNPNYGLLGCDARY
jgi:hypothetical protein